ncbi:hypothetical protein [Leptospira stimsonii]|uniref:Uncharacterized protein n=1 Tax=Leptospira stimsonii TaxID=2202203 RepID=A0A8B3CLX6_9LEPT|nr:hypothetical protein [Leptospira stimsonii]RHX83267.1 hypothetical protein DLM78_22445 [Leptospira stimsonii]
MKRPWREEKSPGKRFSRVSKERFAKGKGSEFEILVSKIINQFRMFQDSQSFPSDHWEEYNLIKQQLPNLQLRRLWKRLETEFYFEDLLKFEIQWKEHKALNS